VIIESEFGGKGTILLRLFGDLLCNKKNCGDRGKIDMVREGTFYLFMLHSNTSGKGGQGRGPKYILKACENTRQYKSSWDKWKG